MAVADRLDLEVTDLKRGQSPFNGGCVHGVGQLRAWIESLA
jgi:hypothetical protein